MPNLLLIFCCVIAVCFAYYLYAVKIIAETLNSYINTLFLISNFLRETPKLHVEHRVTCDQLLGVCEDLKRQVSFLPNYQLHAYTTITQQLEPAIAYIKADLGL